ncbi:SPFH domain-containing protein [Pseudoalteromonas rubra]|uniref:SPFH domain-containing protein n=1 Tax=Pseudoalteromonas rubra TaxID=43658 RepID=UPI002DB5584C|nr:SPFH domain-containing protein [Pseudoalteromonas rubra]MEC4090767.1 SPFH domain-containing protein [Pseudoalteromonas rubra]
MEFLNNLGPVLTIVGTAVVVIFAVILLIGKFYRKVEQGHALIINKMKNEPDVTTTGGIVYPVIHKMEVMDISTKRMVLERRDSSGLICKDNIRADIAITFYIRVNENKEDILRVAKQVGCARASEPETLQELFEAKFSEALKTVGKQMHFEELFTHRNEFRDKIKEVIGQDLSGYTLEDVAIDYLEQTSIHKLDASNILDAEGIRRITEKTAAQNVETNQLKCDEQAQIEIQNQAALEKTLEIERQKEDAMAKQKREIETVQAREEAEAERVKQEERLKSEEARLKADEAIQIAEQNRQREVDIAEQNRLRVLAIEEEKVARSREIEVIEREKETEILRINKEKALEVERKEIADVQRDRVAVEKTVAEEQERIKDVQTLAAAERDKQAIVIRAQAEAEEALVKDIEAAKAQEQAADFKAREMEKMAEAELRIANQQAESKKILAEATQVEAAASGLAEADVIKAKAQANALQGETDAKVLQQKMEAEAHGKRDIGLADAEVQTAMADAMEKQGEAEAINLERRMSAEAKGLEEKLQALNAMDKDARDYEGFTLQLNQQKELTLAQLEANKDIAAHQAQVLAKALSDADINFMGGDGQFFNQFMNAITLGKSIDGLVNESQTVQTVFKDHLNGERNLMDDLKGVLAGANASSETLKNINMSKFFQQLSNTSDAEKQQLLSLLGNSLNGNSAKNTTEE